MDAVTTAPPRGVRDILDRLDTLTGESEVPLRRIVAAFGETAYLPLLMVLALIIVSPLSGIPFLPTVLGTAIALVAGQMLLGKPQLWLPDFLMRRTLNGSSLHGAIKRLERLANWIDRHAHDRLQILIHPPLNVLPKVLCVVAGLAMPFLELVPFSSSLLGLAVLLICTGLLTRDGLYVLIALFVTAGAASLPLLVYGGIFSALAG